MPDLNLDPHFFGHLKTKRLKTELGETADVYPLRLFAHTAIHHPVDGKLLGYTPTDIESFIDWKGTPGMLFSTLLKFHWLDEIEGGYRVHGWKEYQGHLAAYKLRGRAAARARWAKAKRCNKHTSSMRQAMQDNDASNAPTKLTKLTKRNEGRDNAAVLLSHLNQKAGRSYRDSEANMRLVLKCLDSVGGDVEGVKAMLDRQIALWKGDPKMDECLRPSTLFRLSKFTEYYDNRNMPVLGLRKVGATEQDHLNGF